MVVNIYSYQSFTGWVKFPSQFEYDFLILFWFYELLLLKFGIGQWGILLVTSLEIFTASISRTGANFAFTLFLYF